MPLTPKTQGLFRIDTPAKITLHLEVLGRREDGYHDVRLVLLPVGLYDSIFLSPLEGGANDPVQVEGDEELGSAEENLVARALLAFQETSGMAASFAMRLVKRIPAGAGLGGGSGNAGGLLMMLNRYHGHPLHHESLIRIARSLGADVPFFLHPCPALAEGIGEKVRPIGGFPEMNLLIVKPELSIATGQAYREIDQLPAFMQREWRLPPVISPEQLAAASFNRFEEALFPLYPELASVQNQLLQAGALGARLSGSGSALFGIFKAAAARDTAAASMRGLAAERNWRLFPVQSLVRHRYDLVF